MPVSFRCPECSGMLSVPKKLAGQTINCPHNGCAVRVPFEAAAKPVPRADSRLQPAHVSSNGQSGKEAAHKAVEQHPAALAEMPAAKSPASFRAKVARFITAESTTTAVQMAADGKLPELNLAEGGSRRVASDSARESNPLVLISALCLSFGLSAILLMTDFGAPQAQSKGRLQARRQLEKFYQTSRGDLQPYQIHLRAAQQAYSRSDYDAERDEYRKVLRLLRAEGRGPYDSVTRSRFEDEELEKLLALLLAD